MLRGKNQIRIGAFHDLPPDEFSSQISDEKKRKALFVQQCREEMKFSAKYLSWIDKDFQLFHESKKVTPSKIEQKVGETIKLTRESGPNIHDASINLQIYCKLYDQVRQQGDRQSSFDGQ